MKRRKSEKVSAANKESAALTLRDEPQSSLGSGGNAADHHRAVRYIARTALLIAACAGLPGAPQSPPGLRVQIFAVMSHMPGVTAGHRVVHAKGIVCQGTFKASPGAAAISRASHFRGAAVPVTVRFSDGAPDVAIPDGSPNASPRGMAIRFLSGPGTDIVALSHNGFVVGTGQEFLDLEKALAATDPSKPTPGQLKRFWEAIRTP